MTDTATLTPTTATVPTETAFETNNARRHRMRLEASAKHAAMVQATRLASATDKATRAEEGFEGREGYVAWTQDVRDKCRDALDGTEVTLTLSRLGATKRGSRVACTGVTKVGEHVLAIRGEATVQDATLPVDGVSVVVRLTAKRGERRNGSPFTGFTGESVGVSSNGQRIGLRATLQASRFVRVHASAL